MKIVFFGSSLVSAYWNGAATYYRGILRALADRGHDITFHEPDAYDRQQHRDMDDPPWARIVVYDPQDAGRVEELAAHAGHGADVVVKASGVGVHDGMLERAVVEHRQPNALVVFWDVDAPATLDRVHSDAADAFRALIPRYDMILTYGGGPRVMDAYHELGARLCRPIYNALDPSTHHPVPSEPRFAGTLGFLGNRLPDREARVEAFFLHAAARLPSEQFLLGGSGWGEKALPDNVRYVGHVYTRDHNAFNCTPRVVLNINRESMARYGYSPPTRVFEAAGAGACLITDAWHGLELFLEPEREVLVAHSGDEVAELVGQLGPEHAARIGAAAYRRVLAEHTYAHRAIEAEQLLLRGQPLTAMGAA